MKKTFPVLPKRTDFCPTLLALQARHFPLSVLHPHHLRAAHRHPQVWRALMGTLSQLHCVARSSQPVTLEQLFSVGRPSQWVLLFCLCCCWFVHWMIAMSFHDFPRVAGFADGTQKRLSQQDFDLRFGAMHSLNTGKGTVSFALASGCDIDRVCQAYLNADRRESALNWEGGQAPASEGSYGPQMIFTVFLDEFCRKGNKFGILWILLRKHLSAKQKKSVVLENFKWPIFSRHSWVFAINLQCILVCKKCWNHFALLSGEIFTGDRETSFSPIVSIQSRVENRLFFPIEIYTCFLWTGSLLFLFWTPSKNQWLDLIGVARISQDFNCLAWFCRDEGERFCPNSACSRLVGTTVWWRGLAMENPEHKSKSGGVRSVGEFGPHSGILWQPPSGDRNVTSTTWGTILYRRMWKWKDSCVVSRTWKLMSILVQWWLRTISGVYTGNYRKGGWEWSPALSSQKFNRTRLSPQPIEKSLFDQKHFQLLTRILEIYRSFWFRRVSIQQMNLLHEANFHRQKGGHTVRVFDAKTCKFCCKFDPGHSFQAVPFFSMFV